MSPRHLLLAAATALVLSPSLDSAAAQHILPAQLSPRIANYQIAVTLDPTARTLSGDETLVWRNVSRDTIRELRFHLYLNAFRNSASTFMRRSSKPNDWGWIDITSLRTEQGEDLTGSLEFIAPDDGNDQDRTVVRVPLPSVLPPGARVKLQIAFAAKLPRVIDRTGYRGTFFLVAQWFPKIGVYEPAGQRYAARGGWNCRQFHAATEFYSDFGAYDVQITLPQEYVVGATGTLVAERSRANGTKTLTYRADDVHDFAWTASPEFVVVTGRWHHVSIRALMQPQRASAAHRYLESAQAALAYMDRHVGPYPYTVLTIVDPAYGAEAAGGMEYPTFITSGMMMGPLAVARYPELVTIHEFVHQYWYGIVASNEVEEAWLDEGVTTYYETRIMDEIYGDATSLIDVAGLRAGDLAFARLLYAGMRNPKVAPIARVPWSPVEPSSSILTYQKTALVLATLERLVGRAAMDSALRTYFQRWQFRHPSGRDFVTAFNDVIPRITGGRTGSDLNWFFDQTLFGTDICDYAVSSIANDPIEPPQGYLSPDDSSRARESSQSRYRSTVRVSRLGEVCLPVEVLVRFENGEEQLERWDGRSRTMEFSYRRPQKIASACVDPARKLLLDINVINNSRSVSSADAALRRIGLRVLFWIQNLLQSAVLLG